MTLDRAAKYFGIAIGLVLGFAAGTFCSKIRRNKLQSSTLSESNLVLPAAPKQSTESRYK